MDPYYFSLAHVTITDPSFVSIPVELGYTAEEWSQKPVSDRFDEALHFIKEFHRAGRQNVPYYIVNLMQS